MANLWKNIIGKRYGQLIVIKYLGKQNYTRVRVRAKCDCGNIKDFFLNNLQRKGHTLSCGCLRKEITLERCVTHGLRQHPLYRIWADIKTRCYNDHALHYYRYGGRGVRMCEEWLQDAEPFIKWAIANGWEKGLRIDKDKKVPGNLIYGPEFCLILTNKENAQYTRRSRKLEYNGVTKCAIEWAHSIGIEKSKFHQRVKKCGYNLTEYFKLWGNSI